MPVMPLRERDQDNRIYYDTHGKEDRNKRSRSRLTDDYYQKEDRKKKKIYRINNDHYKGENSKKMRSRSRLTDNDYEEKYGRYDHSQKQNHDRKQINNNNSKNVFTINHKKEKPSWEGNYRREKREASNKHEQPSKCQKEWKRNDKYDCFDVNEEGHLDCRRRDTLNRGRFEVLSDKYLGEGAFGRVFKCEDKKEGGIVAVKIIRDVDKYIDSAVIESKILKHLNEANSDRKHKIIELKKRFWHGNHVGLVFPKYDATLLQYLESNRHQPFTLAQIQQMIKQLLDGLQFLHEEMKLTHTDLKPENLLLENASYESCFNTKKGVRYKLLLDSNIQIIDFGSATYDHSHHSRTIQTRPYRAPEVVLKMDWNNSCDIWSCGCIILEIFNGDLLFYTHSSLEHMAMMERLLGPFPKDFIGKSTVYEDYFNRHGEVRFSKTVDELILPLRDYMEPSGDEPIEQLYDLLKKLLQYIPENRCSAREALKHPFFELDLTEYRRLQLIK